MIVVAAVALCLVTGRNLYPIFRGGMGGIPSGSLSNPRDWMIDLAFRPKVAVGIAVFASLWIVMLLLIWSLAFFAMRLRMPRPALGQVLIQPGMVAVESMWAGVLLGRIISPLFESAAVLGMLVAASAVPVAWGVLGLTGRWCPEPGWIDRFGRLLGVCWCVLIPVCVVLIFAFIGPLV